MPITLTKPRRGREVANTYKLPQGDSLRRALKAWFRSQRNAVAGYLKTGEVRRKDVGDVTELPGWDDFELGDLPMSERMAPIIAAIWEQEGSQFLAKLGLDPNSWDVTNPHLQEQIDKAALDFCQATNATTSQALADAIQATRDALATGLIDEGESIADLTSRIQAVFDRAENWRARMIAASEASRATHAAQEQSGIESGVVTGWKWLLSSDACPLCHRIAASCPVVRLNQPFAVIGTGTYATIKYPPAHPSCRCAMTEVLDVDEQPAWGTTWIDPDTSGGSQS